MTDQTKESSTTTTLHLSVIIYRVFRRSTRPIFATFASEEQVKVLQDVKKGLILNMLDETPWVFTKETTPFLAKEFVELNQGWLEEFIMLLEAYPASFHNGATQEIGIGFDVNQTKFSEWPWLYWNVIHGHGVERQQLTEEELESMAAGNRKRPIGIEAEDWTVMRKAAKLKRERSPIILSQGPLAQQETPTPNPESSTDAPSQ